MNLNPIEKINEKDIKKVVQLDNRPNVSGGYGQAKLSAEQLKAWFDAYPAIVRKKVDDIISILSSGERSGDYIALRLEREDKDGSKITLGLSLYDLIESFANGSWANYFTVQTAQATESESLIACLNSILKTIGNSDTSDETVLGRLAHLEVENKTQATEIAENAKGIASNKAYAEQNTERIVKNETDIANNAKDITQIKRRLQFVEGATLSVESNSEVAFEKITPTNAGTYATIEKIGCITVRNSNLCTADGYYELKDELRFEIKLGVLEAGEYTFYFEGDFTGASAISCSGESIIDPRNDITANTQFTLSVFKKEDVSLYLYSVAADSNPEEPEWDTYPRLNGTITGIMLCNASDADKSYRPYLRSDNLCKADGRYDLSAKSETYEEQMIPLDLGVLDVGTYQLQWYGNIRYLYYITIAGDVRKPDYSDTDFRNNYIIIEVLAKSQITVTLKSEWYEHGHEGGSAWDGVITGIMLVKIPDAESPIPDLKYEEKSGILWKAKPTGIESRGANLISFPYYEGGAGTVKTQNGITFTVREDYGIHIKGKATSDAYFVLSKMDFGEKTISAILYEQATNNVYTVSKRLFYNSSNKLTTVSITEKNKDFDEIVYPMANRGATLAPYKPYSAEPIATLELPEAVQSLDGWGLGIDAEYNNLIEVRNGRVIYVQKVNTKAFNGTENFYLNNYLNDNGTKGYQTAFTSLNGTAPLCNIFEGMKWVGAMKNYTVQNVSGGSLVFITDGVQSIDEFKAYLADQYNKGNPVTVVYALAEPIETDITHLFPNFSGYIDITTEAGGSVFALNKHSLPVPWTITYITKA
jgi:hypothetical protein